MNQFPLFDQTAELLRSDVAQQIPYPIDTETAAKVMGISVSTLNRAKNTGKLPYQCSFQGGATYADYCHQSKGKDFWRIYFKTNH